MAGKPTHEELERLINERSIELKKTSDQLRQKEKECMQATDLIELQKELSILLTSTDDLIRGLEVSLEAGLKVSGMDCGGIYLFNKSNEELNLIVHQGLTEKFACAVSRFGKDSENFQYVKKGKPAYTIRRDFSVTLIQAESYEGIRAFITLPLLDKGKVVGCMNLASHTVEDIPLTVHAPVETVAAQIGGAISRFKVTAALKESEERLRDTTENALAWIWEVDSNGRYTYSSPVVKQILGYKPQEVLGKHFFDFFDPEEREELKKTAFRHFDKKQPFRKFINRNLHKDGKSVWILTSGVPLLDKKGNHICDNG